MSERYIVIPGWDEFQHYKDKTRPTWIRLYPRLLRKDEFMELTVEQRLALIGIWMLYAETGRKLSENTSKLSSNLQQRITKRTLNALNEAGFIEFRSRDALEKVYPREEKRRIESNNSLLEQLQTPRESQRKKTEAEIVAEQERRERSGWVENLNSYTGCRMVRGEVGSAHVYDPLGTEHPPRGWPYERPTKSEIQSALAERAFA